MAKYLASDTIWSLFAKIKIAASLIKGGLHLMDWYRFLQISSYIIKFVITSFLNTI